MADQAAGVVICSYIGRIFGQNIADKLIYRIIALLLERTVNRCQYLDVYKRQAQASILPQ